MPPKKAPAAPAVAAITPMLDAEVKATLVYKILAQFSTPKGIAVCVRKELWPLVADLPDWVYGVIDKWMSKEKLTIKVSWTEENGETNWDTEDLHILLLEQCAFKLLKGPRGEALHLRGTAAREHEAAQPKQIVKIPYVEGAENKEQEWVVEPHPESIVNDARQEPRYQPKLARRKEDIDTPFKAWYNAAVSHKMFAKMEAYFNQRLSGTNHDNRKTSRGELVRFCCLMGALACSPGKPVRKMWQRLKLPKDIYEPAAMGRFGIGINRFETLKRLAGECYPLNEVGLDSSNPWRFCDMPVNCYNEHMEQVFEPGWNTGPDESMSAYVGEEGEKPDQIPHAMQVDRKPEPRGAELEDWADAQCGCICGLEINEGAKRMAEKQYVADYGATAACSLRLSKNIHHTNRAWGGDSWFMGVKEVETILSFGLYPYGDVKTHTSRYPSKELIDLVGPDSGNWAVMSTVVAGGHKIFAIGHRRGGTVHTYISSHGTSLTGTPQAHKDDVDALGAQAKARPCPSILNTWTAQQPQIDKRNRERQHELAMEKRFVTANFPFRLFTTILGITFTTANCFYDYFYCKFDGTFVEFVSELCYDGLTNEIDTTHARGPDAPPAREPDPPGMRSPFGSPGRQASLHKLCSIKDIKEWKGAPYPGCSVCAKHTSRCCAACSTGDKLFALCDPASRDCLSKHKADLTDPKHTMRVSVGRYGKRKVPSDRGGSAHKTPRPTGGGSGSRSGGSSSWDTGPRGDSRGLPRDRS